MEETVTKDGVTGNASLDEQSVGACTAAILSQSKYLNDDCAPCLIALERHKREFQDFGMNTDLSRLET